MAYPMPPKSNVIPVRPATSMPGLLGSKKIPGVLGSWVKGLVTLIIVLIIIGSGGYFIASYAGFGSGYFSGTGNFTNNWQAVFLTNNQVYFGKIAKIDNNYVIIRDIYYLQVVTQPLQQSNGANQPAGTQGDQQLTLVKLGNELHGPKDEIVINRDQVILMEDLKNDSRVVLAINDYLSKNKK